MELVKMFDNARYLPYVTDPSHNKWDLVEIKNDLI